MKNVGEVTVKDRVYYIYEADTRNLVLKVGDSNCAGTLSYMKKLIYIDESLDIELKAETLRHELTHAVLSEYMLEQKSSYSTGEVCELVAKYGELITSKVSKFYKVK